MSDKFHIQYRITSARLSNWDYSWKGFYFITICTKNRERYFGEIKNGKMQLSNVDVIANLLWSEIVSHTINAQLGEIVVTTNHVHGVLILDNYRSVGGDVVVVETLHATSLQRERQPPIHNESNNLINQKMSGISPKPNSISTIIRSYKSAVTKHANRLKLNFEWQPRFYDHIIRNDDSFRRISNYIKNNPTKWEEDIFFG